MLSHPMLGCWFEGSTAIDSNPRNPSAHTIGNEGRLMCAFGGLEANSDAGLQGNAAEIYSCHAGFPSGSGRRRALNHDHPR